MSKDYDLVFKSVFHPFFGEIVEITRPNLAKKADFDHVEFLEQEAFSGFPEGERAIADLVAKVRFKSGEKRLVLIHLEIEGEFRKRTDERVFNYYLFLRLKYRLPLVTIVIFLRGGQHPIQVRRVSEEVDDLETCVVRYVAFCLGQNRAEDFLGARQAVGPFLAAMMKSDWDPVEKKLRCLRAISELDVDEPKRYMLARGVDYCVDLNEAEAERFAAEVDREANEEVQGMTFTWEEALLEREAKGEAKGEARGKAEGEARAARNYILRILQKRLSAVPAYVREKLEKIDSVQRLEEILDQAIVASSVDDLVLEP